MVWLPLWIGTYVAYLYGSSMVAYLVWYLNDILYGAVMVSSLDGFRCDRIASDLKLLDVSYMVRPAYMVPFRYQYGPPVWALDGILAGMIGVYAAYQYGSSMVTCLVWYLNGLLRGAVMVSFLGWQVTWMFLLDGSFLRSVWCLDGTSLTWLLRPPVWYP
ncbi:hypothetical protein EAI_14208 [Harpegnathos saltator]|uniref:Uncharacterized protein n=1 Tax=Harpegnathos saltator TaxID=610380 RepID=E2C4L4_HARSA|nr:hypothetical protein EAI_14208 [Harpegnathos saltator]